MHREIGFWLAYLSLDKLRFDRRPGFALRRVAEQVHDDSALRDGLIDIEEVGSRHPTILLRFLPGFAILANSDNDVQPIVAKIQALPVTLGAIANQSERIVLEVILQELSAKNSIERRQFSNSRGACPVASHHALNGMLVDLVPLDQVSARQIP
jgi:hypothetical protein